MLGFHLILCKLEIKICFEIENINQLAAIMIKPVIKACYVCGQLLTIVELCYDILLCYDMT